MLEHKKFTFWSLIVIALIAGLILMPEKQVEKQIGADLRIFTIGQGGTGTSTSPTSGQILIGDGSGKYIVDDFSSYDTSAAGNPFDQWLDSTSSPSFVDLTSTGNLSFNNASGTQLTVSGGLWGNLTGTATSLSSDPSDCTGDTQYSYQIDASGNLTCGNLDYYTNADWDTTYNATSTKAGDFTFSDNLVVSGNATTTDLTFTGNGWFGTILSGTWNGTALTDTYISDTLTCSDLVSGSSVVSDGEVDNDLTISGGTINNSSIGATTPSTGSFTTASSTSYSVNDLFTVNSSGNATSTRFTVGDGTNGIHIIPGATTTLEFF